MIIIKRVNSKNPDFIALVAQLDNYLTEVDGDEHDFYHQFNSIDKLQHVIIGNFIRWINLSNPDEIKLMNGGFVADFKETDTTIHIVCKTAFGRFFNVNINKCVIFQKLNDHEETLLAVINYLDK